MARREYHVAEPVYERGKAVDELVAELNGLGADGWRLVAVVGVREWHRDGDVVSVDKDAVPMMVFERELEG